MPSSNYHQTKSSIFYQTAQRKFEKISDKPISEKDGYLFLCEYASSQILKNNIKNIFIGTSYNLLEQMKNSIKDIFQDIPNKKSTDIINYVNDCCLFQFINEYEEDHITNCASSLVLNFDPKIFYLLDKHSPFDKIFFTLFSQAIVIRLDEIIYHCMIRNCLTKKHLAFTFNFSIGHEMSHIKSGTYNSQYEYIAKHWNNALRLYDDCDILEQQADKEGLIFAIKNQLI
jgi:hypothetical protein